MNRQPCLSFSLSLSLSITLSHWVRMPVVPYPWVKSSLGVNLCYPLFSDKTTLSADKIHYPSVVQLPALPRLPGGKMSCAYDPNCPVPVTRPYLAHSRGSTPPAVRCLSHQGINALCAVDREACVVSLLAEGGNFLVHVILTLRLSLVQGLFRYGQLSPV